MIDMGAWLTLNADAIQAIQAYGGDVEVRFTCQNRRFSCLVPAGFDFAPCMLTENIACVLCVAEAVVYQEIQD